jgi:hypothetical protein
LSAWALWKQCQWAVMATLATSVLLFCDGWFDIVTAHDGRCLVVSVATAVFAEIPVGVLLGLLSIRMLRADRVLTQNRGWWSGSGWPGPENRSALAVEEPSLLSPTTGPLPDRDGAGPSALRPLRDEGGNEEWPPQTMAHAGYGTSGRRWK